MMTLNKKESQNPLDMDYSGTVQWAENYIKHEEELGHVLKKPSPALLTTIYAKMVVEGSIVAGKYVKLACERHLKDLKRSKEDTNYPWRFDEYKAWRPIRFVEAKCKPSKGDFDKLVMQPWQHFIVGCMFGWVSKETGKRRFRESLIFLGRKNGKLVSPF